MKERPIIFNGPMVRAIFADEKGETRRIVRPPFEVHQNSFITRPRGNDRLCPYPCPYGTPGDRLWVREAARRASTRSAALQFAAIEYRADEAVRSLPAKVYDVKPFRWVKWSPSIHMPRWASRILLEVLTVHAERLQAITTKGILAEGVRIPVGPDGFAAVRVTGPYPPSSYLSNPRDATPDELLRAHFASLWDTINVARGFAWDLDPLVWVVTFRRIDG